MAEGRGELAWTVASHVMATFASYQTGKVIQPWVFNPLEVARRKEAQVEVVSDITILKELFVDPASSLRATPGKSPQGQERNLT